MCYYSMLVTNVMLKYTINYTILHGGRSGLPCEALPDVGREDPKGGG